jgi:hypothetical protein
MTIEEAIETALVTHTIALDIDGDPPVAYPNVPFPDGEPKPATYIEVRHHRNTNTRLFVKGSAAHLRQGIWQLTVFTPLHVGQEPSTRLAGQIAEHFPADLALFDDGIKLRVQAAPDVGDPAKADDDVSWSAIVSVRYEVLA